MVADLKRIGEGKAGLGSKGQETGTAPRKIRSLTPHSPTTRKASCYDQCTSSVPMQPTCYCVWLCFERVLLWIITDYFSLSHHWQAEHNLRSPHERLECCLYQLFTFWSGVVATSQDTKAWEKCIKDKRISSESEYVDYSLTAPEDLPYNDSTLNSSDKL